METPVGLLRKQGDWAHLVKLVLCALVNVASYRNDTKTRNLAPGSTLKASVGPKLSKATFEETWPPLPWHISV